LISLPSDVSVNKDNISVNYSGGNHTWQDAVDDGIVIGFIYDWNESEQNYDFSDSLIPGEGYWIYAYSSCDLWIQVSDNDDNDYITDLLTNWNLVGLPYDSPIAKDDLTVFYDGVNHSWQDTVTDGVIIGFLYDWNESTQNYDFSDSLIPGEGYWIYAYSECILKKEGK